MSSSRQLTAKSPEILAPYVEINDMDLNFPASSVMLNLIYESMSPNSKDISSDEVEATEYKAFRKEIDDFVKKSSIICYSKGALEKVHEDIELFAKKEGLTAHANSIAVRFEK